MSTWIITGAGTGLGHTLAQLALEHGQQVVLGVADLAQGLDLARAYPERAHVQIADVTAESDREALIRAAVERFGGVDVLVNNAGIDFIGAVEEQLEADYRAVFEVNFFGAVGMLRAALPTMRRQRRGTIVNISSMDGIASLPINGYYSASKFALEGISDALAIEVAHLGIRVLPVEPGSFRTGILRRTAYSGTPIEEYGPISTPFRDAMDAPNAAVDLFPGDPVRAAQAIYDEVTAPTDLRRLILGSDAINNIARAVEGLQADIAANRGTAAATDFTTTL